MSRALQVAATPWSREAMGASEALCAQAERAEAMGLHSFWLPENHFSGSGAIPAPLLLLAACAARTRRIRLGCTSYLLPIRHPLLAAEEVAVLDQLCGGRLILGLGRGIQGSVFSAFGIDGRDKRSRFRGNLEVMRRAWRGEPVGSDSEGRPILLAPLPVQRPQPPLWVAALGPLALDQVAELGLPYLASPLESLDVLTDNYRRHRERVAALGLSAVATVPVMRTVFVTTSAAQTRTIRARLQDGVPAAFRQRAGRVEEWAIVGCAGYVRDRLARYRERLGMTHLILRGAIAGVDDAGHIRSHEAVLAAASRL